jgi:two-component system CitB family response regulator/CitB family two-component system response regulator MalR
MNILLVDDDPYIRELIDFMLESEWHIMTSCPNVKEATDKVSENMYDLLITDIVMPNEDGISLIKYIKQNDINIPVIAITAGIENAQDDYVHYAEMFADLVLKKPVKKQILIDAIQKLNSC